MEAAASIVGIVSFGLGLAKSLQTFIESVIEAEETIILIVAEVHATASTLKRLQDFIEHDKAASEEQHRATVFNDTGLKEIGACALQCQKIYVQIIILIEKASMQDGEEGSKDKGPQASAADDPNTPAIRLAVFSKNVTKLGRKMKWPWLEPRIKRCQEHLGRLKVSLMLSLQVFLIAESRSRPFVTLVSGTNDEGELRDRAETLRKKMAELRAKQDQRIPPNTQPPRLGDGIREVSVVSSATSEAHSTSRRSSSSTEPTNDGNSSVNSSSLRSDRARWRRKLRTFRAVTALRAFKAHVRKRKERRSVFKKDSSSAIFEAYLICPFRAPFIGPFSGSTTALPPPMKLPFGHRRLTREVKRALRRCDPWDVLLRLSPAHRALVDQVVQQVQLAASNSMDVCLVAIDVDSHRDKKDPVFDAVHLTWSNAVLFFRLEPVYSGENMSEHKTRVMSGSSRFAASVGNVFRSNLGNNMRQKKLQVKIKQEKDEKERQEAQIKADREAFEKDKAEMEEDKKALEVERNRIQEDKDKLEAERTQIAEEKESVESRNRALKKAEEAVLKSIERGTAEQDLKKIFEVERAGKMIEEDRAKKMMENERSRRRMEEEHVKKLYVEKAAAEKAAMERERAAAEKAKLPVKFKDAVGRKFTFPFHLAQTWQGMEDLIKQAFLHVETIGPEVQEGHYDLLDSEEQVILPSIWAETVKPGASISMRMWPTNREPLPVAQHGQHMDPEQLSHFGMQDQQRAAAVAAQPGHAYHPGGASGLWESLDARIQGDESAPTMEPSYLLPEGAVYGRPPSSGGGQRRTGKKKKTLAFFGGSSRPKKSSGSRKFVYVDPLSDSHTRKSTRHGEDEDVEEIYNDELGEDIDKELGLDDLTVLPEKMAPKDIDELLAAWTNPVRH